MAMMAPLPAAIAASRCSKPSARKPGVEVGGARAGEPERLLVVAGVALEGLVDEPAEPSAGQRGIDPAEVALHLGAPLGGEVAGEPPEGPSAAGGDRVRQGAGDGGGCLVPRGDEVHAGTADG